MAKRAASEISDDYGWSPWSNNFNWFDGPHAKVLVGPEKTCFMIHRTLLVHLSGYFRGALDGRFAEADKQECILDEEDPAIFRYLNHWIYSGELKRVAEIGYNRHHNYLCRLWILGDSLVIPELQNAVVTALIDAVDTVPWLKGNAERIWENTTSGSKLRLLIADLYWKGSKDSMSVIRV